MTAPAVKSGKRLREPKGCPEINHLIRYAADLNGILAAIGQKLSNFERKSVCGRLSHKGGSKPPATRPGRVMSFETTRKSALRLELRPAEDTRGPDARIVVLLPSLEELLGEPGFGRHDPIVLPGCARPLDGWAIFGSVRERGIVLH
jgi:hypothetical protein